jgi:thiamine biosynthesis lipoprotein
MASDCEVLIDTAHESLARRVAERVESEARRIERKFSRYRDDSVLHRINRSSGRPVEVDSETAHVIDFAVRCYELTGGRFDITSGVLRRVWKFDGSDNVPTRGQVDALLPYVGWSKISWTPPNVIVPKGMELDLGGIGKEYAVDRAANLVKEVAHEGVVVNFGGDIAVTGPRRREIPWRVGIEHPDGRTAAATVFDLSYGAVATSGDARRFLQKDGVRYSHILDARTGWPVRGAPRSVSVLAASCTEAGMLATMAVLQGPEAEAFLEAQGDRYWCIR